MASGPNPGDRSRFAKLAMAINEELTQACRDVLEMEVPPGHVYNKVKASSIYKKIRPEQELHLIGAKTDGYKEFDITLLYTLIRNICSKIPHPKKGWGGNTMPSVGEISIGDDIERIRMIRNNMFGHISSASTSQTEFDDTWIVITDICQRLQTYTKKDYMSGLSNIQSQSLEEENETNVIEKLKEDYNNNQSLIGKISSLEEDLQEFKSKFKEKDTTLNEDIFESWLEDNRDFVSTAASKIVEEKIKSQNLVTVVGNSGCGKTAIIQHIALKFKEEKGWDIKPVDKVKEIKNIYSRGISLNNITMFVLNDPIGKETLDEVSYDSWKTYETTLTTCLKKIKLLVSCRRCVIYDERTGGILKKDSNIVEIDSEKWKLSDKEKSEIFKKYCQHMNISDGKVKEIIKTEAYFPLLCKLFSCETSDKRNVVDFFRYPSGFIKQEIEHFKTSEKKKYCALLLIVVFNNQLNVDTIRRNDSSLQKYRDILGICELPDNTNVSVIRKTLREFKGSYVKRVGNAFQFLHDFIMEIVTLVFGVDCPQETIQYAESGFLRRRVRIEDDTEEKERDPFTVYLPEEYIGDLVDRFITDMQTQNLVDVILNPCLRKESVIKSLKEKVDSSEKLLVRIKCEIDGLEFASSFTDFRLSRLCFLDLKKEICPLLGFIIFCHNELSTFFLEKINETRLKDYPIFSAISANGKSYLLNPLSKEYKISALMESWSIFSPIHVASVFHNFSILEELVRLGADVNKFTTNDRWTPLFLASLNDALHLKEAGIDTKEDKRRNYTIICLLNNGADINFCTKDGVSPLYIACKNGHVSTVQLLLNNGADINLSTKNGASPLLVACQNGHDSTVQLLLNNGADINLSKNGFSAVYIAGQNGHDSTVQLLLNNGADINLCTINGASPLFVACQNGHDSTSQLLLNNGADINLSTKKGFSAVYIAGQHGHDSTVQLLLNNGADINLCTNDGASPLFVACLNGHDSTVQLLLNNGADINLCTKIGISPLYIACQNGHDSTVQLLLNNGADANLCDSDGASPLHNACQNGHDSTVQLLLNNGADINLCNKNGASPLYIACQNGHDSTVQLILNNGAEVNLCTKNGFSPVYIACQNGHDSTILLLLNNGADINLHNKKKGASPLFVACQNGRDRMVQLLLNNGADINLCHNDGYSPLYIGCQNGHERTVQLLLSNGADINLSQNDGACPLYIACQNGHDSIVQLLLNKGADMNLCDNDKISPVWIACQNGLNSTVQLLLNNGADVNLCNRKIVGPLNIACFQSHDSTVQLLLKNGADINSCDINGASPLFIACQNGHNNMVQLLVNNGADINLCNKNGASPLYIACQNGHESTVQLLLNNGADINLCDNNGDSSLHIARQYGHDSTVQLLLNSGADTNLCNKKKDILVDS